MVFSFKISRNIHLRGSSFNYGGMTQCQRRENHVAKKKQPYGKGGGTLTIRRGLVF